MMNAVSFHSIFCNCALSVALYYFAHGGVVVTAENVDSSVVVFFHGTVLNDLGAPVSGALVQFWHADANGIYKHPQCLKSRGSHDLLLPNFQYYGTAATDETGGFDFTTYRPGVYPSRPVTHIHYKVWYEEKDVLTSQFYFQDENNTQFSPMLQLDLVPLSLDNETVNGSFSASISGMEDGRKDGFEYYYTNKTIFVDLNLGGNIPLTPSQQEGPYYPVEDFFDVGSDLTKPTMHSPGGDDVKVNAAPGKEARWIRTVILTSALLISFFL
mmetsp:Transcript_32339/g.54110  ORF Transcript_32339/g.54110 Transcript_32339/m.54110 type:complete len:270 (+) Transcript_32339:3-812(+)